MWKGPVESPRCSAGLGDSGAARLEMGLDGNAGLSCVKGPYAYC